MVAIPVYLQTMKQGQYTLRNRISLVYSGEDYFSLLIKLIEQALHTIHLQVYIYDNDETGKKVAEALKSATAKGVAVYLHIDGYASQKLSGQFIADLKKAGVQFKFFEPLFKSRHYYFGRRLHHKVCVVDGLFSLVGGINISNRYNDMPGASAWFDVALYCEGEASYQLHLICKKMWGSKKLRDNVSKDDVENFCNSISEFEHQSLRVRRNDWVKRKNEIWNNYRTLFALANEHLTIMSSYFLPGRLFRRLLSKAVKRGVKVKVILADQSDVMLAKHAERYLYDWLLRKKIDIYEFQGTVLHGKITICDRHWVTIGSYNVNNISAYASLELNMDIRNKPFANYAEDELSRIISERCKRITHENYRSATNLFRKLWQWISYNLINFLLTIFTFYFKQRE